MTRAMILIGFAVAFVAGWVTNQHSGDWHLSASDPASGQREPMRPTTRPRGNPMGPESYLVQQLELSSQQQAQMREIWMEVAGHSGRQLGEQRRELQQQRQVAIEALVPSDNKAAYDAVLKDYQEKLSALESQSRQAFATAIEQTRAILTDAQRQKYDQIMQRWNDRGGQWDREHRPPHQQGQGRGQGRGPGSATKGQGR